MGSGMNYCSRLISDFNGFNVFVQKLKLGKKLTVLEVSEFLNIRSLLVHDVVYRYIEGSVLL